MTDAHAHAAAPGDHAGHAAGDHGHADLDSHLRAAYIVFGSLLVLTGLTVGASYLHLPVGPAIALALLIATIKGGLVLGWFMHLISERRLVFAVLSLTVVFFFFLLLLPYWTTSDIPTLQTPGTSGASHGAFTIDRPPQAATPGHGGAGHEAAPAPEPAPAH